MNIIAFFGSNRPLILKLYHAAVILLLLTLVLSTYLLLTNHPFASVTGELASKVAEGAIIVYATTLLPGIFRRFRKQNKLVTVIMMYRRQIGILSFYLMLLHVWIEEGINRLLQGNLFTPVAFFEWFGLVAFFICFLLYVTSNDFSTKRMGVWWTRIHALTYAMVWFIFLHVAINLQYTWAIVIGLFGVLEVISHLYARFKK